VVEGLQQLGANAAIELAGVKENITFSIPKELRLTPAD
jgi:4-hydroxy-3-methylbut-2-enyl diphosphate reductase